VLLNEAIDVLNIKSDGIYVDGTLGRGGHSSLILSKLSSDGRLICFDQDDEAISAAKQLWGNDSRITLVHRNFVAVDEELARLNISQIDGMLLDLGVSSPQFDNGERGFSYRHEGQLDMRMDRRQSLTAYEVVNSYSEEDLRHYIYLYGEEKKATRIARLICQAREKQPINTTLQLAEIIKKAFSPAERQSGHPARRTFQALRILVNSELDVLEQVLPKAIELLAPAGILCVLTFHSLEDRIVKQTFRNYSGKCTCPPGLPICVCGQQAKIKIPAGQPLTPAEAEIENNPRARSVRMRWAKKL